MKKNGIIPPHFLYFLENEGIDIIDFKSSNFDSIDAYDRIIIKFPFCSSTLDIQAIFDNVETSLPPDFIILNECDCIISYKDIVKEWNFKESASLYQALKKIKDYYSNDQEKKLYQLIQKSQKQNESNNSMDQNSLIFIDSIITHIKQRLKSYKQLPRSSWFCDITLSYSNQSKDSKQLSQVEMSYPLDCLIRSREINRAPVINIIIPINKEMTFFVDLVLPHFVSRETITFAQDMFNLYDYQSHLHNVESTIIRNFNAMHAREKVITKIIETNIGFPLTIDTFNFLKLNLYCHHIKTINVNESNANNINAVAQLKQQINSITSIDCNFLLHFLFSKDENSKLEFQIIDCDQLSVLMRKKIDYGTTEREINNVLHLIVSTILDCFQAKKKRSD